MKWILLAALVIVVLGVGSVVLLRVLRERQESSVEGTMRQFQRGLEALDPENDPMRNANARGPRANQRNSGRRGRK